MISRRTLCAVLVGTLAAAFVPSLHAQDKPANVAGKWQWSFNRPDGQTITSTVDLKQDGNKLTGASVLSTGEKHEISNGKVEGNTVSFDITREREGRKITAKYSGKLEGDSIKGKIETPAGGETRSFDWEAKRVKETK